MLEFEVQKFSRRCAKSDRDLKPGETFYSILKVSGSEVIREDYSAEAWEEPPDDSIGWWKSEVPDPKSKKLHWAPNDVMLHYFQQLESQPQNCDLRYVLTLLMIRRRVLRLDETTTDEEGNETLIAFCPRNETEYSIAVETPSAERVTEIQRELAEMLFAKSS